MNEISKQQLFSLCRDFFTEKRNIQDNSKQVNKGDIFVALRGIHQDGHDFIPESIQKEDSVIVAENLKNIPHGFKGRSLIVENTKLFLSLLLNHYYDFPSKKMFCVGITGSNGKTTVSYMLEKIFSDGGWKTGVIGTIDHHLGDKKWNSKLTTPKIVDLNQRIFEFYKLQARATIIEVSSIGLDQYRVDNICFNVGIFTNLMRDHLDYHKDMQDYYQSKKRFFEVIRNSKESNYVTVLNADDEYSYECRKFCRIPFVTYGKKGKDMSYSILSESMEGMDLLFEYEGKKYSFQIPIVGIHNASNACCALLASVVSGFSIEKAIQSLEKFKGVPGRLQRVNSPCGHIFVDYAHTPDALYSCLRSLKNLKKENQKIITVFGCGGERDQGKRKFMGQVVDSYSDFTIITSDNPRGEDPEEIVKDILEGVSGSSNFVTILDRKEAIKKSLEMMESEDIILVAGKGHEDYQILSDKRIQFNDVEVINELLHNKA